MIVSCCLLFVVVFVGCGAIAFVVCLIARCSFPEVSVIDCLILFCFRIVVGFFYVCWYFAVLLVFVIVCWLWL